MPLTLVHPLAVWPLRRTRLFSAFVAGSMAPDFRRLTIPMGDAPYHTWSAAVEYYLPSALLALFLYHRLIKLPMISLAARRYQPWLVRSSPNFPFTPFSRFAAIVLATFAGIATHLLWDAFTHPGAWGLIWLGLDNKYIQFATHYRLTVALFLWDLSTLIGIVIMSVILYRAFSRNAGPRAREPKVPPIKIMGAGKALLILMALVLAALPGFVMLARDPQYWLHDERRQLLAFFAVSGLDVVLLEIVTFSVLWQIRNRDWTQEAADAGTSADL